MKLKTSSLLIAGALFGAAVLPVQANNEAMMELLKVLRDQGTITAENYELLANAAKADKEASEEVAKKVDQVEKESTTVSLKGGHLKFKSGDKKFSAQIGGRLMADYAFMDKDDLGGTGNSSEIRRARLFVKGTAFNDWGYKAQFDFAGDETTIKDMYLQYNGWKPAKITLGNHKMPFSLDDTTSSKYITFIERSAATEAFVIGRKNGLSIATGGHNWSLTGAVHMEGIDNENSGQDEDYGYGMRATFTPLAEKNKTIHLGAALHHQELEASSGSAEQITLRPEVHTAGEIFTSFNDTFEDYNTYGLELAGVFGPLSFQSEYAHREYNAVSGSKDQDMDTWYAFASYFLTGESRPYDAKNGVFGRVKPKRIVGEGGYGAWEVALRYSDIDLEDNGLGDKGDLSTLGLNWYATPTIRFMANYTTADVDGQHDDFDAFHFRGQVDF